VRKLMLVCLALAAASPTSAVAQTWIRYGAGQNGTVFYYDSETIRRDGQIVRVWERQDHSQNRSIPYREAKALLVVNCTEQTVGLTYLVTFNADGTIRDTISIPSYRVQHDPAVPGSVSASLLRALCTG